jgi:hypothetical protein
MGSRLIAYFALPRNIIVILSISAWLSAFIIAFAHSVHASGSSANSQGRMP